MEASARYYDGRVSTRLEVRVSLEGENLQITGPDLFLIYPVSTLEVTSGVGAIRRSIKLPDGGMCRVAGTAFLSEIERMQGKGKASALLHRWERNLPLVLGSLILLVAAIIIFMRFGLPPMARKVAFAIPPSMETSFGRETLATLDSIAFRPTRLRADRRVELENLFRGMTATIPGGGGYRLIFRDSPALGANAMALPSGIVVMTDQMVALAKNDQELAAVLAHELGHVKGRHLMRHVLQNSVTTLLMASITGDIMSVSSLSAAIPTSLIDAKFSRDFEREADDAACVWLKKEGIPVSRFVDILQRLQLQLDRKNGAFKEGEPVRNYLSTHPATDERIRRILAEK